MYKKEIFSPRRDLVMACHIPPLKKAKKQGEVPLPILSLIHFKNVEFRNWMGVRMVNGISLVSQLFWHENHCKSIKLEIHQMSIMFSSSSSTSSSSSFLFFFIRVVQNSMTLSRWFSQKQHHFTLQCTTPSDFLEGKLCMHACLMQ